MADARFLILFSPRLEFRRNAVGSPMESIPAFARSLPDTLVCISKIRDGFLNISDQPTLISHLSFQELTPQWCYRQEQNNSPDQRCRPRTPWPPTVPLWLCRGEVLRCLKSILWAYWYEGLAMWVWPAQSPMSHAQKGPSLGSAVIVLKFLIMYEKVALQII